jgi:hypothetical protein
MINFSGHPVPGIDCAPLVGVNIPTNNGDELKKFIRETLKGLPDGIREKLLVGAQATIVLPGLSHASGVLLAEWHGQFGSFPKIVWAVRGPDGFQWPPDAAVDLDELRLEARTQR